jgi:glycosyltransferase involved in cell wall biosynthesis
MRIAYVVPRCVRENSHGRYVLAVSDALARYHETHIFSAAFPDEPLLPTTHRVPLPNHPTIARLASWWSVAPLLVRGAQFDAIHTVGADAPVGTVVTAPCCNLGIRRALEAAGISGQGLSRRRGSWVSSTMDRIGEAADRIAMTRGNVRRVLAPSRQVASELQSLYCVAAEKITVTPWGVDLDAFSPATRTARRADARNKLGYSAADVVCLYVGGAYRLKGLLPLLEAFRRLPVPRLRLLVVGPSRNSELEAEVENGLAGRVTFLGRVMGMQDAYAAADLFVLPTLYDGFSLATLEAMACGVPVVVTRSAGISDFLTDGKDSVLLERFTTADEIAQAIRRVVDHADLADQLGLEARVTAERFSWGEIARQVTQVYAEIQSERGTATRSATA